VQDKPEGTVFEVFADVVIDHDAPEFAGFTFFFKMAHAKVFGTPL